MCPYCQKTFKTSVNCKKHMKTHRHELAMQALQQQQSAVVTDQATEVTISQDDVPEVRLQCCDAIVSKRPTSQSN